MSEALTGGCLCGAIRYEITARPTWVGHCHCSMCRRAAGAPIVTWLTVPTSGFRFTKGQPRRFISSEQAHREFCPDCGAQIIYQFNAKPELLDISAASLDNPEAVQPQEHVFWEDRLSWMTMPDGLPHRKTV